MSVVKHYLLQLFMQSIKTKWEMTIKKLKISALVSDLSHYALCVSNSNPSCHRHIQIQITPYLVPYILARGEDFFRNIQKFKLYFCGKLLTRRTIIIHKWWKYSILAQTRFMPWPCHHTLPDKRIQFLVLILLEYTTEHVDSLCVALPPFYKDWMRFQEWFIY